MSCTSSLACVTARRPLRRNPEHDRVSKNTRVLVVDDSSDGRRVITGILRCLGLETQVAENGRIACKLALSASKRGEAFDLILMDTQMPELDGCQATALLRSAGYAGRIVALTSDSILQPTDRKCMEAGCDGHATKPITFQLLRDTVDRYLPQARQASAWISEA